MIIKFGTGRTASQGATWLWPLDLLVPRVGMMLAQFPGYFAKMGNVMTGAKHEFEGKTRESVAEAQLSLVGPAAPAPGISDTAFACAAGAAASSDSRICSASASPSRPEGRGQSPRRYLCPTDASATPFWV